MTIETIRKFSRVPVVLAIAGAYLNSAQVLAFFQPEGRAWVGWLGALAVSIALFITVEAFLVRPSWITGAAIVGYGLTEILAQLIHAAQARADLIVMTPLLEYALSYIAPSVLVIVGLTLPVVIFYGLGAAGAAPSETDKLGHSISVLADALERSTMLVAPSSNGNGRKRTGKTQVASSQLELPEITLEQETN